MASCYGSVGSKVPTGNENTRLCCPYLPLFRTVKMNDAEVEITLTLFATQEDFIQGLGLMNDVIKEGKSWPFMDIFETMEAYKNYFHSHAAFAVKFKDEVRYGSDLLGCFYVKPNFPGRCSHVCNGGFITNKKYRGMKIGAFMGEHFKRLAKDLGYRASLFNLVFVTNEPSVRLWNSLGYTQLAVIPKVAVLEGFEGYVDAYQFYCDFYPDCDIASA